MVPLRGFPILLFRRFGQRSSPFRTSQSPLIDCRVARLCRPFGECRSRNSTCQNTRCRILRWPGTVGILSVLVHELTMLPLLRRLGMVCGHQHGWGTPGERQNRNSFTNGKCRARINGDESYESENAFDSRWRACCGRVSARVCPAVTEGQRPR